MRALIADDEPFLRADLKNRLGRLWSELTICAEAADGNAALEAFDRERPDIAFLDIRMPGQSGLEVAAAIAGRCHIVFVTAFDKHAVEAFERGAHDYVVKPVSDARLQAMVARLQERIAGPRRRSAVHRTADRRINAPRRTAPVPVSDARRTARRNRPRGVRPWPG